MTIQEKMFKELEEKTIFEQAQKYAHKYLDDKENLEVFPSDSNLAKLKDFEEALPEKSADAKDIVDLLYHSGQPATVQHTGGKYFGFVNGSAVPASIAAKLMNAYWDQCGGLYLTSPLNSKLESICESWLKEILNLPDETTAGFVSGTSMANFCALAAARFRLLKNQGWDVNSNGLFGAPRIKVLTHKQIHASIKKTLALIGFGLNNVSYFEVDDQGRAIVDSFPEMDNTTLVLLQAGNVNSGAFDPFDEICDIANKAGAWVHVDGAFGLWAAACKSLKYLTKGMEKANSWAVDGHKTLNTPYDSGVVLCRDQEALVSSLQASADYIIMSDQREPILYNPEMSKRSRAIELWATMKYLGKSGIEEMITGFHLHSKKLAKGLSDNGFRVLNDVVFNQTLIACENEALTKQTLAAFQKSGDFWAGGSIWKGEAVIRLSVCSWATTEKDIEQTVEAFVKARASCLSK